MSEFRPRRSRRDNNQPQPKQKLVWKNKKPLIIIGAVLLFLFFTFGGYKLAEGFLAPIIAAGHLPGGENSLIEGEEKLEKGQPVNIMLLGVDQRDDEPARSDTIMVAALFADEKQIKLLSIPRDTYVSIPGRKNKDKINHAHAYGGTELTQETLAEFLDIPIHFYLEVNFEGFVNVIDILGGIEVDVEKRMYYPDENIDLQAGLQILNGEDSLGYVRFRSDGQGDIGRIARQQKFLSLALAEVKSAGTIFKIPGLIKEIVKHVETDMPVNKMAYLAIKLKDLDDEYGLQTYSLDGYSDTKNGISYWNVNTKKLEETMEEFQKPTTKVDSEKEEQ